jgi:hypothetical protein
VRVRIEYIVRRVVLVFDELALPAQDLADQVQPPFFEHTLAFQRRGAGSAHALQRRARQRGEIVSGNSHTFRGAHFAAAPSVRRSSNSV